MTRRQIGFSVAVLLVTAVSLRAPQKPEEQVPPTPDRQFDAFVDRYFDGLFHFDPARATRAGFHQYDSELPAYSRADIEAEVARLKTSLPELERIPRPSLSRDHKMDARLLASSIRGRLLDFERIRRWERDPDFYNEAASRALFVLVERDFAPADARLKSLIARERRVPEILENARRNVANPPAVYTRIAERQAAAELDFLRNAFPKTAEAASDAQVKAEFARVNAQAVAAYEQFLKFLQTDLEPRSRGSFALGAELYRKKLLYDEMVAVPIERLLRIGEAELRRTQDDFKATAELIDPTKPPEAVLADLSRDHPDAAHVIPDTQAVLDSLRRFVTSHDIATIASQVNPTVVETPPFMRALTFASMDTPGPYEENSTEAFYNVTLPDPAWTSDQVEEHLRFFNRTAIQVTSIHEVFPGHYTQFLRVRDVPGKVGRLIGASSNAEGWAHYSEQMMLEQGYGEGDPKLLLFQLHAALLRLCRYLVGIRMHTQGMTLEEGTEFFKREAYMEQVNAEREALRGTADPTYLVYTLGKLEIVRLRDDVKRKRRAAFKLKEFHDQFLSYGYPPVKLIREEMLGDNSPPL